MTREQKIELCAQAAHEINRIYCLSLNDNTQEHWENAPEWQKQSSILGVKGILSGNTPEESHNCWLKVKRESGWVYGLTKDVEKKQHPCMVPYSELPENQKVKDTLFSKTVKIFASVLDLK